MILRRAVGMAAAFLLAWLALAPVLRAEDIAHRVQAQPAIWQVTSPHGHAVLLGSMHILPRHINWRTPEIDQAFAAADTLVFEVPIDDGTVHAVQATVAARGTLPAGQSLRAMVPPDLQENFDKALKVLALPEAAVTNKRPWLITFMLDMALLKTQMKGTVPGVDVQLMQEAKASGKALRYLESADQQLALLAPSDPEVELQYFLADLKGLDDADGNIAAMTDAWAKGDVARLDSKLKDGFADMPRARDYFFTDRNRAMAVKLAAMLQEDKTFLVVVGAGHLTGQDGIPALLRAKGFAVTGP